MTPQQVFALCREKDVKAVDLRFVDLPGTWRHFTIPVAALDEDVFENGLGFDGSSIRGWQSINESDMLAIPLADTAFVDPFSRLPSLVMFCAIKDPITQEDYSRDPRNIASKAVSYLKSTGMADTIQIGSELEFFVFDDVRFDSQPNQSYYHLQSDEAEWNRGRVEQPNLGHKIRAREGYFPVPPADSLLDLRNDIMQTLVECGIAVEAQHHEVASAGQCEIDMRYAPLVRMADQVIICKYVVKNIARRANKSATFMPQPLFGDHGSGMHLHFSLWKDQKPLFWGKEYAGLSEMAIYAIGGILRHAPALLAFTNPTTNSYKRLAPGHEAPVNLTYSQRNRSACCGIPMIDQSPRAKRIEFRCPDPSCNPYLAFSAMLLAAVDGIQNKIHPGPALEKDFDKLSQDERAKIPQTPGSLEEALLALEKDHDFLLRGNVFTRDLLECWVEQKRCREADALRLRPHPYEFCLYYDV